MYGHRVFSVLKEVSEFFNRQSDRYHLEYTQLSTLYERLHVIEVHINDPGFIPTTLNRTFTDDYIRRTRDHVNALKAIRTSADMLEPLIHEATDYLGAAKDRLDRLIPP